MGLLDIFKINDFKNQIAVLSQRNAELVNKVAELGIEDIEKAKQTLQALNSQIENKNRDIDRLNNKIKFANEECEKSEKRAKTALNKLNKSKELYQSIEYSIERYLQYSPETQSIKLDSIDSALLEELSPSVTLKLHYMDVKSLRKAFRDNEKRIEKLLNLYRGRYTTKANQTIYELMVIALRAELQNILYNLKYEKLDNAIDQVKEMAQKYLSIAAQGNQSIAGTLAKFVGELEYLFINAVKIEYNYYVKREQAKQEQAAIREQMRQEAEERKALEQEKKKIEKEEAKYTAEIDKLKSQVQSAEDAEREKLNARILELEAQLADVAVQKDNITKLQNGKAGNVYIISNLGSFGNNIFKVGMTRRMNPQDRVNELGDASVPFKFDVHSFIFSEDAVGLEHKLHTILNEKRVNKVNLRKEFFYTSVDELESLVNDLDPTAEFNKTMLAEEFRQSQSSNGNYTSELTSEEDDDDE